MDIVYAHEFGNEIRSSAYKYYLPLQRVLGGEIVGVNGRDDHERLRLHLRKMAPDVVLVRGDASNLYRAPLEAGIPYVVCENDVSSWRKGTSRREHEMLENAVGVVFTSDGHREHLEHDGVNLPPSTTVLLRPTLDALDFEPLPKLDGNHLVYAGGLLPWKRRTSPWGYRCYRHVLKAFLTAGWQVHLYPTKSRPAVAREYRQLGCQVHDTVSADTLYRELSQYTAGLHGYSWHDVPPRSLDYALHCMPNKTWEYLAAGIPTITVNGGISGRTIVDGGWGVEVDCDLSGLDMIDLPAIDSAVRVEQTIDGDIVGFAGFVRQVTPQAQRRRELV